jgi:integrase/recombinase XerD
MTALAPALQAFFTERLITQRNASPQTIAAYRDTFKLLLGFAHEQTGKRPFQLDIEDLDAPLIGAFLAHLEQARGNSPRTRNARLGAIHSFYRFAALEHPEHAATIARVMAIPTKRHERNTVCYLDLDEITALLAAPDRSTWLGRRDHALLMILIQTGVRVSELVGLRVRDVHLGTGAHIRVTGKGRKKRATTLTGETVAILRAWLTERRGQPDEPLFPTRQGRPLSRYTVGVAVLKARRRGSRHLPIADGQAGHPAHAPAHQRDAAQGQGCRHRHDRAVARPRKHPDHPHLRTRRPEAQGAGDRAHRTARGETRQIPTLRHAARVPRQPLTMLNRCRPECRPARGKRTRRACLQHNRVLDIEPVTWNST